MNNRLFQAYRFHRHHAVPALRALASARADFFSGVERHIAAPLPSARPGQRFRCGNAELRCLPNYERVGFLFMGYADAFTRARHKGWYSRSGDTSGTFRGAVFTMRWRNGQQASFAGYIEMDDDEPVQDGAALIEASPVKVFAADVDPDELDDLLWDVAMRADTLARDAAMECREHDAAWRAGNVYFQLKDTIGRLRREVRETVLAARANVTGNSTLCALVLEKIHRVRRDIRELIHECRALASGSSQSMECSLMFDADDKDLRDAFNRGADQIVLT
jgi:hypothetical protein